MGTSRDGFEVVNSLLRADTNRRAFLKTLSVCRPAWLALQLRPWSLSTGGFAQQPKRGGTIKIGSLDQYRYPRSPQHHQHRGHSDPQ